MDFLSLAEEKEEANSEPLVTADSFSKPDLEVFVEQLPTQGDSV